ncbi:hypothetical protein NC652_009326 [Populus alba x Populus x berolinensis]|nr:hypothetical protein NC652_009326 [Populus alba x Populus x berolinensis]
MWPPELATASTANEIGGSYEINTVPSMIQPPIEQYMSFLSGCLDSPTIPDSKLKRKAPDDVNRDQERKKEVDRAYRQRCKFMKIKNEEKLCVLTEENNRLNRENKHLKNEEVRLEEVVQTQNENMKQLKGNFCQLKSQLDKQNIVVEVLSKQLVRLSLYLLLYFNSVIFFINLINRIFFYTGYIFRTKLTWIYSI